MIVPMFLHPLSAPPMSSLPALHRRGGVLEAADRHLVYGSGAIVAAPPAITHREEHSAAMGRWLDGDQDPC